MIPGQFEQVCIAHCLLFAVKKLLSSSCIFMFYIAHSQAEKKINSPYSVHIKSISGLYLVHIQSMSSPCPVHIQSIFSPYPVHIQSIFSPYSVHIQSISSPYAVHIQSIHSPNPYMNMIIKPINIKWANFIM